MSQAVYEAIQVAKDLDYSEDVIQKLQSIPDDGIPLDYHIEQILYWARYNVK